MQWFVFFLPKILVDNRGDTLMEEDLFDKVINDLVDWIIVIDYLYIITRTFLR